RCSCMVFALLPTWRRREYYILCAAIWGIAVFKEFSDVSQQALEGKNRQNIRLFSSTSGFSSKKSAKCFEPLP
ncbi:MAG: hypothetical protein PHP45_09830, partial [Elusimicrobiales bacterium]|nr:hypothetical protein [Elusimicrobiales bacterium]